MHAQANTGPLVNMAGAHDTSFPLEPFNRVVPSGVHPKWADRSEEASSEEAYNDTPSKGGSTAKLLKLNLLKLNLLGSTASLGSLYPTTGIN